MIESIRVLRCSTRSLLVVYHRQNAAQRRKRTSVMRYDREAVGNADFSSTPTHLAHVEALDGGQLRQVHDDALLDGRIDRFHVLMEVGLQLSTTSLFPLHSSKEPSHQRAPRGTVAPSADRTPRGQHCALREEVIAGAYMLDNIPDMSKDLL